MINLASPKNYNEMLSRLNKSTALSTLVFFIFLQYNELIPKVEIDEALIPPINEYFKWFLSFGIVPLAAAIVAFVLSHSFELHNVLAKYLKFRDFWDKHYIVKPLYERGGLRKRDGEIKTLAVMRGLYYPQVKKLDEHYTQLFWRYAATFWALFEHFWIVFGTTIVLEFLFSEGVVLLKLWLYCSLVLMLALAHWYFILLSKTKSQVMQIPQEAISDYFDK